MGIVYLLPFWNIKSSDVDKEGMMGDTMLGDDYHQKWITASQVNWFFSIHVQIPKINTENQHENVLHFMIVNPAVKFQQKLLKIQLIYQVTYN